MYLTEHRKLENCINRIHRISTAGKCLLWNTCVQNKKDEKKKKQKKQQQQKKKLHAIICFEKKDENAMVRNRYNRSPHPAPNTKREKNTNN